MSHTRCLVVLQGRSEPFESLFSISHERLESRTDLLKQAFAGRSGSLCHRRKKRSVSFSKRMLIPSGDVLDDALPSFLDRNVMADQ